MGGETFCSREPAPFVGECAEGVKVTPLNEEPGNRGPGCPLRLPMFDTHCTCRNGLCPMPRTGTKKRRGHFQFAWPLRVGL